MPVDYGLEIVLTKPSIELNIIRVVKVAYAGVINHVDSMTIALALLNSGLQIGQNRPWILYAGHASKANLVMASELRNAGATIPMKCHTTHAADLTPSLIKTAVT